MARRSHATRGQWFLHFTSLGVDTRMSLKMPAWMSAYATRFLPFADAASHDLPLGRLLRLSMFQLVIGMIMALMVGTLNRVMIVELHVPAWWVAMAVAIPMVFAPLRTLIGYRSDTHPSALGLRRIPYLWTGSLQQDQVMEQCWFTGSHSDIGGGYQNCGLSDVTLQWMVSKACALGLEFNQDYLDNHCKPNLLQGPHNSYSLGYKMLERFGGGEAVRRIYGDPANPPINISIHDSVYQRIASRSYLPQNPDFPSSDKLADRRSSIRFQVTDTPLAKLTLKEFAANCQLLDFSKGGGARIQYDGELHTGDTIHIDSDRFGSSNAECVWKKGNQYGLRFAA